MMRRHRHRYDALVAARPRRAAARQVVLSVIAIALLGLAAFLFGRGGMEAAPTDASSWTYYTCEACGAFFHYNGAELEEVLNSGQTGPGGDRRSMAFKCRECGAIRAVRAGKCSTHGEVVKINPGPDDPATCSQCDFRGR